MVKRKRNNPIEGVKKRGRRMTSWQSLALLIFIIAAGFGLVRLVLWSFNTSFFRIETLNISGLNYEEEKDVREQIKFVMGRNILRLDLAAVEDSLRKLEYVREARVYRALPKDLRVEIEERHLLALFSGAEGLTIIDTDGKRAGKPRAGKVYDLPIVTECPASGEKYYRAVNFLLAAKILCPAVYSATVQLTYNDEVLVGLMGEQVKPVYIGKKDFAETVMKIWILMNKSERGLMEMEYADLRYKGKVFYKKSDI